MEEYDQNQFPYHLYPWGSISEETLILNMECPWFPALAKRVYVVSTINIIIFQGTKACFRNVIVDVKH